MELPFPHKALWPNGRSHFMTRSREAKKHKQWAHDAMLATIGRAVIVDHGQRFRLVATFYPKPKTTRAIDKDNAIASLKAYQDGIALAIGFDDNRFDEPRIQFGEIVPNGRVTVVLEAA